MLELIAALALAVGPTPPYITPSIAWGDAQHAWAGGFGGIVATSNGGASWHVVSRSMGSGIVAVDATHAWALDTSGVTIRIVFIFGCCGAARSGPTICVFCCGACCPGAPGGSGTSNGGGAGVITLAGLSPFGAVPASRAVLDLAAIPVIPGLGPASGLSFGHGLLAWPVIVPLCALLLAAVIRAARRAWATTAPE